MFRWRFFLCAVVFMWPFVVGFLCRYKGRCCIDFYLKFLWVVKVETKVNFGKIYMCVWIKFF